METKPIVLLFGMPRSGTTWIGKIFDSHHNTLYRHEPDTWDKINEIPILENSDNYQRYCSFLQDYVERFINSTRPEVNGKLPVFRKEYTSLPRYYAFMLSVYSSGMVSKLWNNYRPRVIRSFSSKKSNNYIVVWKSIQLLGRFGVISNCLQGSKGIHIVRHPCGYIASILKGEESKKFTSTVAASDDFPIYAGLAHTDQAARYGLSLDVFRNMQPIERLAWRWVLFNEKAYDDTKDNKNVRILKYEDMCSRPIEVSRECFDFCGIDWSEQTKTFLEVSTGKNLDAYYSVYKDPGSAANKWRKSLDSEQQEMVRKIVSRSKLGYLYY